MRCKHDVPGVESCDECLIDARDAEISRLREQRDEAWLRIEELEYDLSFHKARVETEQDDCIRLEAALVAANEEIVKLRTGVRTAIASVVCSTCSSPLGPKHYAGVPGRGDLCLVCWEVWRKDQP